MDFEGQRGENMEAKQAEFYSRIDAGEFDDIIWARHIHESEQEDEYNKRMEHPLTPEELLESVERGELDREFQEMYGAVIEEMRNDPLVRERNKKMIEEWHRIKKEGGKIALLRHNFKTDPLNFTDYIEGRLRPTKDK